jgi:hypothetical protein
MVAKGIFLLKQSCLQFIYTLETAGSSPALIELAGCEELLLFAIYQEILQILKSLRTYFIV